MSDYIFQDVATERELRRLQAIEAIFDPATRRHLEATGEWSGRRCLEVGAGAGSIARWMAERAGSSGRVTAVDTSVRFLEPLRAVADVVEGDVREAPLEAGNFDLAHARYVLIHNVQAEGVLDAILRTLQPGGWVLLEEPDFTAARVEGGPDPLRSAFERTLAAVEKTFRDRQLDPAMGRRLPELLRGRGFSCVDIEVDVPVVAGGSAIAGMMALSAVQLGEKYVATGLATAEDVAAYQRFAADPSCSAVYYATHRVLARRGD